jgi:hypothetical protein
MPPAGPTPPTPASLAGFWAGTVGVSADDGRSLGLIWSAGTNGDGLSGTATLSTLPSAPAAITFVGTLTGTRDGDRLLLTYTSQPGRVRDSACMVSGKGTAYLEEYTLVGDLEVSYESCDGLGLQPPASTKLTLLRKLN